MQIEKNHREDLVNTSRKLHPQVEFNEKKIFFPPCPHEISTPHRQILLTFTGFYFLYFLRLLRYDAIVFSPATLWKNLYTYLYIVVTARPHCMLARTASSWSLEKSTPVVAFIFHWVYSALFYLFFDIVASCWLLLCDTDFFFPSPSCRTMKGMLFSSTAFRKWYTSMDAWFTRFNLYGTYNILLLSYFLLFTK